MKTKKILPLLLLAAATCLPASADDFGLWTDASISQKLGASGVKVDGEIGFRANNELKSVDRWNAGIGLSYNVLPFLEIGGGYNFIYRYSHATCETKYKSSGDYNGYNVENGFWRTKNRMFLNLKASVDVGRFTFSLRERYQATVFNHAYTREDKYRFNKVQDTEGNITYQLRDGYPEHEMDRKDHKTTHFLRSRAMVEYNIRKCAIDPYAYVEFSNELAGHLATQKRRYSIGADWKIKKGMHLSVGYVYNNGNDDDDDANLHAIQVSYKIKGLFGK